MKYSPCARYLLPFIEAAKKADERSAERSYAGTVVLATVKVSGGCCSPRLWNSFRL